MNRMLTALFEPSTQLRSKISYLNSALSGHTFRAESDHLKELINKIADLIVPEQSRCEGLALLENALQQCPELYAGSQWHTSLLSVLQGRDAPACKELACKCLILIVENQARNTAREPDAKNVLVPAIIKDVLSHVDDTDAWLYHALRLIAICMKSFPNAIPAQKLEDLRKFILKLMDCLQVDVQDALADCFAALPACTARSVSSQIYKDVWHNQVLETIQTLDSILNYFSNSDRDDDIDMESSVNIYLLSEVDEDEMFAGIIKRAQQFRTLCKCLVRMLSSCSRSSVHVPINQLMELLERIILFPLDPGIPKDIESRVFLTIFPVIQNVGCTLLEAMLLNFPTEMEALSEFITKLFEGLLQASRTNPLTRHQLSQLRSSTWKVLNVWIVQYGVNGVLHILQEIILNELLVDIDITELPAEVTESVKNQKVCLDMYSVKSPVGMWTISSCCEALRVIRDMFYIGMSFMNNAIVQNITEHVILILCKVQNSKDFPFPYANVVCRKNLYKVMLAIVTSQPPTASYALRHSIGLFNRGLKDPSLQIVRICQQSIAHCKNIVHPKKYIPVRIKTAIQEKEGEEWHRETWGSDIPWAIEENQLEQEEDVPQISQTVEISAPQHNETDIISESYSSTVYNEHVSESQVNGETEIEPKFQNWRQDMSEIEEEIVIDKKNYKDISDKIPSEAKVVYSYSEDVTNLQEVEVDSVGAQNRFSEQSIEENSKMECDTLQIVEKDQPGKLNEEVCQNGDVIVSDEEMPELSVKTKNGECSVSSSEENSDEDEEEVEEEEYEEAESIEDSPVKKLQISSEDLESDDGNPPPQPDIACEEVEAEEVERESGPQSDLPELIETEEKPDRSPTLQEMCATFVLAENKNLS